MDTITHGVAWNKKFELGNEEVDLQHKRLFNLVNGLVKSCMDGSDTKKLQETLDFLVSYTILHFQYEEDLQIQYNYPNFVRHKQLHEDFKQTVGELVERYKKNGSSNQLSNDVNKIVVRWLINHIQIEDKKIGEHIRKTQA